MKRNPIVHFEIPVDDLERAKAFYEKTFGWKISKFDMPDTGSTEGEPYYMAFTTETDEKGMATTPGAINGGLMKRKDKNQPFMNYISVDSIEEKLKVIRHNGGTVVMEKTAIGPDMGWIAAFKDPDGNLMGLHEYHPKEKK